ncbi:MAG: polysaccharide biosynthesis/export family protein [Cyanobacteria bacterium P01_D01_bin.1]
MRRISLIAGVSSTVLTLWTGGLQMGDLQSGDITPASISTNGLGLTSGWGMSSAIAQTPLQTAAGSISSANYILGAGDQISLSVLGYPEFTGTLAILPDGSINLPLIGQLNAAGLTPNQLSAVLTQQMRTYLVDPVVNVGLVVTRPVVVTVSGEVYRPGPQQLSSLSNNNSTTLDANSISDSRISDAQLASRPALPTLSSALLLAGGVTRDADIRQIQLRRPLPGGQVEALTFNLWEAITSELGVADIPLRDGDSIYIPTLEGDAIDRRTVASSSLAPSTVRVKVVGEVVRPGEVAVPPNSSVSSAVAIAGGPTSDARLADVSLVRQHDSGEIREEKIDLTNLIDDYQIEEGDVIVVSKRGYLSVVDGIGRVLSPLSIFRLFGL